VYLSKDFLLLECESVRSVLHETLRYEYGSDGSRDFFDECEVRLNFIKQQIESTSSTDHDALDAGATLINNLSALISRIERSNIGEYSWPFVEELKKIANAVCAETTLSDPNSPPKVHVLSDGGLDKYQIYSELKRPTASHRRILTIIFPRSLKHFVLLHPVLGHELGHAIWRGSKYEQQLKSIIQTHLLTPGCHFQNPGTTAAWMYAQNAPQGVKDILAKIPNVNQTNFFGGVANWQAWIEEITCDFIGLLTFGPSFIAALGQLLYSLVSAGNGFSSQHPPVGARFNLMLTAAGILGFDSQVLPDPALNAHSQAFWASMSAKRQASNWFDPIPFVNVQNTIQALQGFFAQHPPAMYVSPNPDELERLMRQLQNQTPPVGFEFSSAGVPLCIPVDFRHILYAGWITTVAGTGMAFADINRLCEHGILQQRAIEIFS
jgi:hypothetical protein